MPTETTLTEQEIEVRAPVDLDFCMCESDPTDPPLMICVCDSNPPCL